MSSRRFFLVAAAAVLVESGARAEDVAQIYLRVTGGKLVEGSKVIRLNRNAAVLLTVLSDAPDELHVHGYNLTLKLLPNKPATLRFVAKHTGRFTFELHHADRELGAFEIYPN